MQSQTFKDWKPTLLDPTCIKFNRLFYEYSKEKYGLETKLEIGQKADTCKELIALLVTSEGAKDITILDMMKAPNYNITDQIFEGLRLNKWKAITKIYLDGNMLTVKSMQLLTCFDWSQLKVISLNRTRMNGLAMVHLKRADWPKLEVLELSSNNLTNEGYQLLTEGRWPNLSSLNLQCVRLKRCELYNLTGTFWKDIRILNLSRNNISRKGAKQIVRANFVKITELSLSSCFIDDEGAFQLAKGKWKQLDLLRIRDNLFSNRGMGKLREANWPKIKKIALSKVDQRIYRDIAFSNWGGKSLLRCDLQRGVKGLIYSALYGAGWNNATQKEHLRNERLIGFHE